jgi:hypothetical protein
MIVVSGAAAPRGSLFVSTGPTGLTKGAGRKGDGDEGG